MASIILVSDAWCHWLNSFLGLVQLGHPVLHQPLYGTWEGGGENETIIAAATAIAVAEEEEEEEEEEASRRGERPLLLLASVGDAAF